MMIHKAQQPLVLIETYGCQMNKCDSEIVASLLTKQGFGMTETLDLADTVIINTCAVRDHAEQRALGRIGVLADWKRQQPHRKLGVMGCMAKRLGDQLMSLKPYLDFVIGPEQLRLLPDILANDYPDPIVQVDETHPETYSDIEPVRQTPISGWVTIMRGCNNFCSYCIVPYTRGRERSRSELEILDEIRQMAEKGYIEVNLLGQNVNSYHDGEIDFPGLLTSISRIDGIKRVRFMTSHPKDLSDRLIDVMAKEDKVCNHIHLPLQAGSNAVLKAMNRKYTQADFYRLVEKTRTAIPGIAITTDIMVGFPGETETDFLETLKMVETIRFDDAFMYHFSPRPETKAAEMKDQLTQEEKLERLDLLIQCQRQIGKEIKFEMVGKLLDVLPESESKKNTDEWMGRTQTNHVVIFPKEQIKLGEIVPVQINECRGTTLRGVPAIEVMETV